MTYISIKLFAIVILMLSLSFSCSDSSDDGYSKALAIAAVNEQIVDDITIFYGPYAPDLPSHPCKFLSAYIVNKKTVSELYPENNDTHFTVQKIDSKNWIVELIDPEGEKIEYGPYKWNVSMDSNVAQKARAQWQLYVKEALIENKADTLKELHVVRLNTNRDYC